MDFVVIIVTYSWPVFLVFVLLGCFITYFRIKKPEATLKTALTSSAIVSLIAFLLGIFGFMIFFIDGVSLSVTAVMSLIASVFIFAVVWALSIFVIRSRRPELVSSRYMIASFVVLVILAISISPIVFRKLADYEASSADSPEEVIAIYEQAKKSGDRTVLRAIADNTATPPEILDELFDAWKGPYPAYDNSLLCMLSRNPASSEELLVKLFDEEDEGGDYLCLIKNPNISNEMLEKIVDINKWDYARNQAIQILEERGVR